MRPLLDPPKRRRASGSPRRPHPDDVLKRLARNGPGTFGPTVYIGRERPFDAMRALVMTALGFVLVIGGVIALPFVLPHNEVVVVGLDDVSYFNPGGLASADVRFSVKPTSALAKLRLRIDGRPAAVSVDGEQLRWVPPPLTEGRHRLTVESGSRLLWRGPVRRSFAIEVDSVAPTLNLDPAPVGVRIDQPVTIGGSVDDGSTVTVAGEEVPVVKGRFVKKFPTPPTGMVTVEARDRAGNAIAVDSRTGVVPPSLRGVHVTAISWTTPSLRGPVLALIEAGKINTVVLDLKDESGEVGHQSAITKVNDLGAGRALYDLRQVCDDLHRRGVRVTGRIVAFRDPLLTRSSINSGRLDEVVLTTQGEPYRSSYGTFANPFAATVQEYLAAIAREAAEAGVDDILLDYVRRPEGSLSQMQFAGVESSSAAVSDGIAAFVEFVSRRLDGTGTRLGVSLFGIAAKVPDQIGQDVRKLSRHVDYVAPMVYPSHWRPGFYEGIDDPANSPELIVDRALADFREQMSGTDAVMVPWLQDFTLAPGRKYTAADVRLQIAAAERQGSVGYLLWDPKVTYTAAALRPDAPAVPIRSGAGPRTGSQAPTVPAPLTVATTASPVGATG